MLAKREVIYYKKLSYAQGGLAIGMLFFCFVAGVSAKYSTEMTFTHLYIPYWIAIPLITQAMLTMLAVRSGKRWPLGIWIPLFVITMAGICSFIVAMPPYKIGFFSRFPCIVQTNWADEKTRCTCSFDMYQYLTINGPDTVAPCVRALTILNITSNVNLLLAILAVIPQLLMFVLVCNDLCCLSCRRAALVPQFIVAGGTQQQPGQYLPVQSETVTYRTDEQPGASSGQRPAEPLQAGPLPGKPTNPGEVPHSF